MRSSSGRSATRSSITVRNGVGSGKTIVSRRGRHRPWSGAMQPQRPALVRPPLAGRARRGAERAPRDRVGARPVQAPPCRLSAAGSHERPRGRPTRLVAAVSLLERLDGESSAEPPRRGPAGAAARARAPRELGTLPVERRGERRELSQRDTALALTLQLGPAGEACRRACGRGRVPPERSSPSATASSRAQRSKSSLSSNSTSYGARARRAAAGR